MEENAWASQSNRRRFRPFAIGVEPVVHGASFGGTRHGPQDLAGPSTTSVCPSGVHHQIFGNSEPECQKLRSLLSNSPLSVGVPRGSQTESAHGEGRRRDGHLRSDAVSPRPAAGRWA
jgi:hypothetical protein